MKTRTIQGFIVRIAILAVIVVVFLSGAAFARTPGRGHGRTMIHDNPKKACFLLWKKRITIQRPTRKIHYRPMAESDLPTAAKKKQ